jgi:hypothetical protein
MTAIDRVGGGEWASGALGLAALLALMNLVGFFSMAHDKRRAERGLWRCMRPLDSPPAPIRLQRGADGCRLNTQF